MKPDEATAMLERRNWVPSACEDYVLEIAAGTAALDTAAALGEIRRLTDENRRIHDHDCINLNPATNVMNPKAEALLAAGLGTRPSLGYPGDKYEMGLEAVERIEVMAAALAAEVFEAKYAEIRVPSGALANLYLYAAATQPGDAVIVPPAEIGGHITHHRPGAAGIYGVVSHPAPIDAATYSVDIDRLREQARAVRPKVIAIGGSLNLFPHPIAAIRGIADEVGAKVLFDAAHLSGMIAGKAWQQPLKEGAHAMTMSTYKSLGGAPSGLIVTDDAELAERLDRIAYPGLTANFDAGKAAALAVTMLDWKMHGRDYAAGMKSAAKALAESLSDAGVEMFARDQGFTTSHQFALVAAPYGGGQAAAKRLRRANLLACGIGLPLPPVAAAVNGLRLGTPEIVRLGMGAGDMPELAALIARALLGKASPESIAPEVTAFRARFQGLHYVV
jgi:glycine hydroxymethyltransferase